MTDKPEMYRERFASAFTEAGTVAAYQYRPPYSPQTFEILADLLAAMSHKRVLDVGCGTGFIARPLVAVGEAVEMVDAIDISQAMVEAGQTLPDGRHPHLNWIVGRAEDAPLSQLHPPYGLITAGDSIHWLDWEVALPRLARLLAPEGSLVIIGNGQQPTPWDVALQPVLARYSIYGDLYKPIDVVAELEARGLFEKRGSLRTDAVPFRQSIDHYIQSFHGRAGCAGSRMSPAAMRDFAKAARAILAPYVNGTAESHDKADDTLDSVAESHDSADDTLNSAAESHDSVDDTLDSAAESHDSADDTLNSAAESHDSADDTLDSADARFGGTIELMGYATLTWGAPLEKR